MRFFNKKFLILFIFLFIVFCIFIYLLVDNTTDVISTASEDIYFNSLPVENSEELIIIHISGEVNYQGIVSLCSGSRIADAIEAAGGLTTLADISKVNLAYPLKDGQKIYIPSIYDSDNISYITKDAGENVLVSDTFSDNTVLVNINSASTSELETLPGIGASTAQKIIIYRENNGRFKSIDELMNISRNWRI